MTCKVVILNSGHGTRRRVTNDDFLRLNQIFTALAVIYFKEYGRNVKVRKPYLFGCSMAIKYNYLARDIARHLLVTPDLNRIVSRIISALKTQALKPLCPALHNIFQDNYLSVSCSGSSTPKVIVRFLITTKSSGAANGGPMGAGPAVPPKWR